jgi:hypothetical protein
MPASELKAGARIPRGRTTMRRKVLAARNVSGMCLVCGKENAAVEARGKYSRLPLEQIDEGGMDEREWYADTRESPDEVDM